MKTVAIVKDRTEFWPLFKTEFEKYGYSVKLIDIWNHKEQVQLLNESFDGFVWRAKHNPKIKNLAKRFIYLLNIEFKIPTYPDWYSYWHYDDKIAQSYLMRKHKISTPNTYVFYDKEEALTFATETEYPIIYKCPFGAGSSNVGILKNKKAAKAYIKKIFSRGVESYFKNEIQKDYVYFQEFLHNNDGDYKVICYGSDNIQVIYRENRKDIPLASGGGNIKIVPCDEDLLNFTHKINIQLGYHEMSYDLMKKDKTDWVITELGIIYGDLSNNIYDEAPVYERKTEKWIKIQSEGNRVERMIRGLLKNQWKWI
jgi:glutathione synthase/RimK-type ligase-like ATP-grasp enzyme